MLDYRYENLDPERFQELCQSLLLRQFPNLQCFPVAQPDGGRDATTAKDNIPNAIIFQVKFRRSGEADSEDWLRKTVEAELPSIRRLVDRGARQYKLLTNISGTAHPQSGTIDKAQDILNDLIPIPAQCWWRSDLNRRLDDAWDIKWTYPEVWTGLDAIRALIETHLSESQARRASAIRAFLRDQYGNDEDVRFRQVELRSKLLHLFIDVPVRLERSERRGRRELPLEDIVLLNSVIAHQVEGSQKAAADGSSGIELVANTLSQDIDADIHSFLYKPTDVGAAAFLLYKDTPNHLPRLVLEGAPGQGKSTLAQYLCQVHRMRLLNMGDALQTLPLDHRLSPARLPFRVDLRDLASWLRGEDPFTSTGTFKPAADQFSLEGFLAAQVRHSSGGTPFDVADLHAIVRVTPVILVLDGLDEVADISERRALVDAVTHTINRLEAFAHSLQVLITSRPAAFANSPGFSTDRFRYCHLTSLTTPLITEYSSRWSAVQGLPTNDAKDLLAILETKLRQPHMRDLARNPMQLAILLSLIHSQGAALPDKRTALYDAYVNTLFNREAEKSAIVRKHRETLVDIHRHLAWILHAAAERGRSRGSISEHALRQLLRDYLAHEGQDTSLVDELFNGMVERVVALVSRIEGSFEFEVQPLREYFAARHLYETAPYSPPGREVSGTKPDRFDAIARSSYWLNVTRFYAGCYSKGELADLAVRLEELAEEDELGLTSHPRTVTALLLADWVFTQYQKGTDNLVRLVLQGAGLRQAADPSSPYTGGTEGRFVLPEPCGRGTLITFGMEALDRPDVVRSISNEVCRLLRANATPEELFPLWRSILDGQRGAGRVRWLTYGAKMDVLSLYSLDEQKALLLSAKVDPTLAEGCAIAFEAGLAELFSDNAELTELAVTRLLGGGELRSRRPMALPIFELASVLDPDIYAQLMVAPFNASLLSVSYGFSGGPRQYRLESDNLPLQQCAEIVNAVLRLGDEDSRAWQTSLAPWKSFVDPAAKLWGKSWRAYELAHLAGSISSRVERGFGRASLFDHDVSLCERLRHARLRAGSTKWWEAQLEESRDEEDRLLWCLCVLTWATPKACSTLMTRIDAELTRLSPPAYVNLVRATHRHGRFGRAATLDGSAPVGDATLRLWVAIAPRLSREGQDLLSRRLMSYEGEELPMRAMRLQLNLQRILGSSSVDDSRVLAQVREDYCRGAMSFHTPMVGFGAPRRPDLSADVAQEILAEPMSHPYSLLRVADGALRFGALRGRKSVGVIAENQGWFN